MAGIIPKRILEDIRARCDIADIIGSYFNLQRAGGTFKALCPFHKEKTPSFNVNQQRQIFHCFGCGAGGDVYQFVMKYEGVDFMGAVKILAHKAGVQLEIEEGSESGGDKATLYRLHVEVTKFYFDTLLNSPNAAHARQYLAKRGLGREIAAEFQIGYAPDSWNETMQWAFDNKFSLEQLEAAGLVVKKSGDESPNAKFYDRFRNRIMFSIRDEQGRVIAFSGRCLDDHDKSAKYVNSPDSPLFHKGRVLYAMDKARRQIVESREAIICEGQIDVIRCHSACFTTAVAAQGTAFTEDHVRILRRYADSVVLVYDSDKAGQDAAIKSASAFMSAGLAVRIAMLPKDEDPDSFIRKEGAEAFGRLLKNALSAVRFQIDVLSERENTKSEIGLVRVSKAILDTINHCPNAVQRAALIQEAAERLGIPASAFMEDLRHLQMRQAYRQERSEPGKAEAPSVQPMEEITLCEHMIHLIDHPAIGKLIDQYLPLEMVSDPLCRNLIKASIESVKAGQQLQDTIRELEDPSGQLQSFAAKIQMAPSKIVAKEFSREEAVQDVILFIWKKKLQAERAELDKKRDDASQAMAERRIQITHDLKVLERRNWEAGSAIIKIERELASGG